MKRGRVEHASLDFAFYGAALDNTPELELADPKSTSPDTDLSIGHCVQLGPADCHVRRASLVACRPKGTERTSSREVTES
jgi:hypothetical protein